MKFLCMSCDQQMTLAETTPPRDGAGVAMLYACPECGHRVGMLTNTWETQVVSSLGVKIGGRTVDQLDSPSIAAAEPSDGLDKCPFGGLVREMQSEADSDDAVWTSEAQLRLQNIPDFVRPMAKQGIEQYAKSNGYERIDEAVLDECKEVFGM